MGRLRRLLLVITAAIPLFIAIPVNAQSNGLGITPRKDYVIKAGDEVTDKLFLSDLSPKYPLEVKIRVVDFKAANETGAPALMLAANAPQTTWSLKSFISIPSSVTVPAGSSLNIPYTIKIPSYQGAGSYYSAIEYTAQNEGNGSAITVAASSATLVFVTVPGIAHESMSLQKFGAYIPNPQTGIGTYSGLFLSGTPQEMAYTLQNNGDVAENPQGSIVIKNLFGKTEVFIQSANPKSSLALIGQTRLFETCLVNQEQSISTNSGITSQLSCGSVNLWPGKYTAKLVVLYGITGNQSRQVTTTASFWYLPWWSLAVMLLILAVLGVLGWIVYMNIKYPKKPKVNKEQ